MVTQRFDGQALHGTDSVVQLQLFYFILNQFSWDIQRRKENQKGLCSLKVGILFNFSESLGDLAYYTTITVAGLHKVSLSKQLTE